MKYDRMKENLRFAIKIEKYIAEKHPGISCKLAWTSEPTGDMFRFEVDGIRNHTYWMRLIHPEIERMCQAHMFTVRRNGVAKRPAYLELHFERK